MAGSGGTVSEYRLDLSKTLDPDRRLSASEVARIIEALNTVHPNAAADLSNSLLPRGGNVEAFKAFANDAPERLGPQGGYLQTRLGLYKVDPETILSRAGYDAIDLGHGVQKITGAGVRSVNAFFNPTNRDSRNIMASIPGAGAVPWPSLTVDPNQE